MAADNATTYTRRWCGTGEIAFLTLSSGTRLRYLKVGTGLSLLLLHTLRTQLDYFQRLIPKLTSHFTVYAVDRTWLVGYLAHRELRRAIRPYGGGRVRRETRPEGPHPWRVNPLAPRFPSPHQPNLAGGSATSLRLTPTTIHRGLSGPISSRRLPSRRCEFRSWGYYPPNWRMPSSFAGGCGVGSLTRASSPKTFLPSSSEVAAEPAMRTCNAVTSVRCRAISRLAGSILG